jgi:hypothetical protein
MKAWVVSVTSLEALKGHPDTVGEVVIALVPARRTSRFIKSYIETLVSILRTSLDEQRIAVTHVRTRPKHIARIDSNVSVSCFDHPYLFKGQKSDIISFSTVDCVSRIQWQGIPFTQVEEDLITHQLRTIAEITPPINEAPQANFGLANWHVFANNRYNSDASTGDAD